MTVPHVETYTVKLVFEQVGMNEDSYEQSIIEVLHDELGYLLSLRAWMSSARPTDMTTPSPGTIEHSLKSINLPNRRAIDWGDNPAEGN